MPGPVWDTFAVTGAVCCAAFAVSAAVAAVTFVVHWAERRRARRCAFDALLWGRLLARAIDEDADLILAKWAEEGTQR